MLDANFSPDSELIVTASCDNTARIWDAVNGTLLDVLEGHQGWVNSAEFSPDGGRIVTASDDNTARVWDTVDGALLFALEGHQDSVITATFDPNNRHILTRSYDNTARIWDVADGKLIATFGDSHDPPRPPQGTVECAVVEGGEVVVAAAE